MPFASAGTRGVAAGRMSATPVGSERPEAQPRDVGQPVAWQATTVATASLNKAQKRFSMTPSLAWSGQTVPNRVSTHQRWRLYKIATHGGRRWWYQGDRRDGERGG
jgi:hypothetical protein